MKLLASAIVILCYGLFLGMDDVCAEKKSVVRVYRYKSDQHPIEVTSRDTNINTWLLKIADETVNDFSRLMGLKERPFSKMKIHWRPGEAEDVVSFPRILNLNHGEPEIELDLSAAQRNQTIAVKRTLVIGLLQAYVWKGASQLPQDVLFEPPLWLSEGILWFSEGYIHDDWIQIVSKASRSDNIPSLAAIQQWEELSELRIEQVWQQAFSYFLIRNALDSITEKRAILLWIRGLRESDIADFWEDSPEAESWWHEIASQSISRKLPLLDWDRTVAELNQLRHVSLRLKDGTRKVFFIEKLPDPQTVELDIKDQSMGEYFRKIDLLAYSGHYVLNPAILSYRTAMFQWYNGKYKEHLKSLEEARQWEAWAADRKASAKDTLDWAVVNLDIEKGGQSTAPLTDYSSVVRELESERLRVRKELQREIFQ